MKLFIIGPAGSGKSTLAKKISLVTKIGSINLDDIFWKNDVNSFGNIRHENERNMMLDNILKSRSWILEGAYVEWPRKGMEEADQIIYIDLPLKTTSYRIIKRFIKRKLRIEKSNKKETLKNVRELLKWNVKQSEKIHKIVNVMKSEKKKEIVLIKNNKDMDNIINRYRIEEF